MYISKTKISYPISLSNDEFLIKRSLALDLTDTDDDGFINSLIEDAIEETEGLVNFDIALTNNELEIQGFSGGELIIPNGNFNSITNIVINDTSTSVTEYTLKEDYTYFTLYLNPTISCESLSIMFKTGYENYVDVPKGLKRAILTKTADLYYRERGSYGFSSEQYNAAWEKQCQQFKLM